jgi:ribosomal subunit interface protein
MKIITKAKNLEMTASLDNFINEKVGSLKKFIDILKQDIIDGEKTLAEVFVEVEKETDHHKNGQIFSCQLEVRLPGKSLVVKSSSDDLQKAIMAAKKEMEESIKKYKFKKIDKTRREQRKSKSEIEL